ncbi:MAG: adenylate/guanylate cyclase domain-containing protein [Thermodesulfobacteriota bacterium]
MEQVLRQLIDLARDVSQGRYDRADELFRLTEPGATPPLLSELAESFGMMMVQVEGREFRLQNLIADLERVNAELKASLEKVQLLEQIRGHLHNFVPRSVARLIEQSPDAPDLAKRERDVSVLFLDIAGYTRMSQNVDPSSMDDLVNTYFSAFLDAIYANHGDVNETAGDGLMILFQQEDPQEHAAAAARSALAIAAKAREINQRHGEAAEKVRLHQGINSGQALVGSSRFQGVSGSRWTYTASGPTTILASRVASLALGGQVLVGPETARRLAGGFRLESLGPQYLKNLDEPVEVFELLGLS